MGNEHEQDLRLLQLRFVGKILAGFTHEIKNHIAIIKESAGLMEDMIKLGKSDMKDSPQYLEIIHSIEDQIEKANVLLRYLNRYSHRMDTGFSLFNINDILEELIALLTRFANQKRISLEKEFREDIPSINSNPSMLQLLVFHFLEEKIAGLDKNSSIMLKTSSSNATITVQIITKGNYLETVSERESHVNEIQGYIIDQLNGKILKEGDLVVISLPVSASR